MRKPKSSSRQYNSQSLIELFTKLDKCIGKLSDLINDLNKDNLSCTYQKLKTELLNQNCSKHIQPIVNFKYSLFELWENSNEQQTQIITSILRTLNRYLANKTQKNNLLLSLPYEILLYIFQMLNTDDRLTLASVCTRTNIICKDRMLLKQNFRTPYYRLKPSSEVIQLPESPVTCMQAMHNTIIFGCQNGTIQIWDYEQQQYTQALSGHTSEITCLVVLSPSKFITGSMDTTLRIWDIQANTNQVLSGHQEEITCLKVFGKNRIISGSKDNTLRVWNCKNGHCIQIFKEHSSDIVNLEILPNDTVVSVSQNGTIIVWNVKRGKLYLNHKYTDPDDIDINCAAISSDGKIFVGLSRYSIWTRNLIKTPFAGKYDLLERERFAGSAPLHDIGILPSGDIVGLTCNGTVSIWHGVTGKQLHKLVKKRQRCQCISISLNGHIICASKNTATIWRFPRTSHQEAQNYLFSHCQAIILRNVEKQCGIKLSSKQLLGIMALLDDELLYEIYKYYSNYKSEINDEITTGLCLSISMMLCGICVIVGMVLVDVYLFPLLIRAAQKDKEKGKESPYGDLFAILVVSNLLIPASCPLILAGIAGFLITTMYKCNYRLIQYENTATYKNTTNPLTEYLNQHLQLSPNDDSYNDSIRQILESHDDNLIIESNRMARAFSSLFHRVSTHDNSTADIEFGLISSSSANEHYASDDNIQVDSEVSSYSLPDHSTLQQ